MRASGILRIPPRGAQCHPARQPASAPEREEATVGRSPVDLVEQLWQRAEAGDEAALDELVAADLRNHASSEQGRDGLRRIMDVIRNDLGEFRAEHHSTFGDHEHVTHHVTLHGVHRASTMPLLSGVAPSGRPVAWTFIHIWRAQDGVLAEHWACRDDVGLLAQVGGWPPAGR